jgi:hypothetical protein
MDVETGEPQVRHGPARSQRLLQLGTAAGSGVAAAVGVAPVALAIHRGWTGLVFLVEAAAVAILTSNGTNPARIRPRLLREYLLASFHLVGTLAFLGALWMALYWAVYWVVRGLTEAGLDMNPAAYGYWVTAPLLAILVGGMTGAAVRRVLDELYPEQADTPSRYYLLVRYHWRYVATWLGLLALVVVLVGVDILESGERLLPHFVLIFVLLAMSGVASLPPPRFSASSSDEVDRWADAFDRAGFTVERGVRTGNAEFDVLVENVPLLAKREGVVVAVEIKRAASKSPPLEWPAGTGIDTATRVLSGSGSVAPGATIRPLLVLIDLEPAESLSTFCSKQGISLAVVRRSDPGASTLTAGDLEPDLAGPFKAYLDSLGGSSRRDWVARMRVGAGRG